MKALLFVFSMLSLLTAHAQTGRIRGVITDASGTLPGATVLIKELPGVGEATDVQGRFEVRNVAPGAYTLVASYIGYVEIELEVTVRANETTDVGTLELSEGIYLEEAVVTGKLKSSEARAINMTRMDQKIVNIIAADGIGKLPDRNVAEAVQRVPAVALERDHGEGRFVSVRGTPRDWSSSLINNDRLPVADEEGTSRTMAYDVFPVELIEYVILAKALTADIEGDAIGGSINFLTKAAPDERVAMVTLGGGYNFQAQKPVQSFSLIFGNRSKDNRFGYLVTGALWNRHYGTDNYELVYGSNFSHGINRLELRDYLGLRTTMGLTASVEYRLNDKSRIYAKGIYGRMRDDEQNRKTLFRYATGAGKTVSLQNINSIMNSRIFGGEVGMDFSLTERINLTLRAAHYDNRFGYGNVPYREDDPRNGYFVVEFETRNLVYEDMVYLDQAGNYLGNPQITENGFELPPPSEAFTLEKLIGEDHPLGGDSWDAIIPQPFLTMPQTNPPRGTLRPSDFEFVGAYSELRESSERDPIVLQADIEHKVSPILELKFGGKLRMKEGERLLGLHQWNQRFDVTNQAILMNNFELETIDEGGFLQEHDRPYDDLLMPFLSAEALDGFLEVMNDSIFDEVVDGGHPAIELIYGSSFRYEEDVIASYGMFEYGLTEKLDIIAGLRAEYTETRLWSDTVFWDQYDDQVGLIPASEVSATNNYWSVLPSVHLKYQPTNMSNLRFAFTRSFRRPNFNEMKPGEAIKDFTNLQFLFGNRNLRPTYSWNYDLMYERFFGNVGLASAGVFYKDVRDHIFATNAGDADPAKGIIYKSYRNAEQSWVAGIELQFNRRLDFLPGFLSGFGINSNVTFIRSEMKVPGRPGAQPLPRQADLLFNAALYYETDRLNARIALNYKGPYLIELNLAAVEDPVTGSQELLHQDTDYDIFMDAFTSLDFAANYDVGSKLGLFIELNNLLNAPLRIYRGKEWRVMQVEYYHVRGQAGLRYKF